METNNKWMAEYLENPFEIIPPRVTRKILPEQLSYLGSILGDFEDRFEVRRGEVFGIEIVDKQHFFQLQKYYGFTLDVRKSLDGRWFVVL